jgi:hypothetical protein
MKTTLLYFIIAFTALFSQASDLRSIESQSVFSIVDNLPNDIIEDKLTILTNPVKDGQLRIKYVAAENVSFNLTIVNSLGEQVFSAKRNASRQELSFDISKLATGIYFLRVSTDETSVVKKLIVQ